MVPNSDSNLIRCGTIYGPTFGYDIRLCDNCNRYNSSACFPTSYNVDGPNKYANGQASWTAMVGATDGKKFRATEYEVFQVIQRLIVNSPTHIPSTCSPAQLLSLLMFGRQSLWIEKENPLHLLVVLMLF